MDRARTTVSDVDLPAASELRERVLDIVENMIDRVGDVVDDTTSTSPRDRAMGAARGIQRHTRGSELASAAAVAAAPAIARAIGERIAARRASTLSVKSVPAVVLSRPALIGLGAGAAIAGGLVAVRLVRRRRRRLEAEKPGEDFDSRTYDVDEAVAQMQDEGGSPDGGGHAQRSTRRFVRSPDEYTSAPPR